MLKKISLLLIFLIYTANISQATVVDGMFGVAAASSIITDVVIIKNSTRETDAYIKNINAQTENIKNSKGNLQIIRQPDGSAKVYQNGVEIKNNVDTNSPEYKLGLRMADNMLKSIERKKAKEEIKEIKALAKVENDTQTLAIIKKYKKAGPIVTLQKIREYKKTTPQ